MHFQHHQHMYPIPERPALNPWTRPIRLRNGQLRLMCACRTRVDLSPSESADVSAACELLAFRWPLEKIESCEASSRGISILANLGQLIDSRILQMSSSSDHNPELGRALALAALFEDPYPHQSIHAPGPLPPSVGVVAPPQWQPLLKHAFHHAGIDRVTALSLDSCRHPQTSPSFDGITLVVMVGELDWTIVAQFMGAGLTHLPVTPSAVTVEIGPHVSPGITPCLRCVHLAKNDDDPHWSTTTESIRSRPQPPTDPALAQFATQLAVSLAGSRDGEDPTHGSVVLRTSAPYGATAVSRVEAHPMCGCQHDGAPARHSDSGRNSGAA
jgi:hypothetical protein